jgi:hypothetical protein
MKKKFSLPFLLIVVVLFFVALLVKQIVSGVDEDRAPVGFSWYEGAVGYRILLKDGWVVNVIGVGSEEENFFPPEEASYFEAMNIMGTTPLTIVQDYRSMESIL